MLGVDPGSRQTGYGIIRQRGRSLVVVESGTFRLNARHGLAERLGTLQKAIEALVERHVLHSVGVEDIFSHRNPRSALALGQARGVILGVCGSHGLQVEAYPPASVKQAVVGHGRADKSQIQRMVTVLLALEHEPSTDEADALAVAICHALRARGGIQQRERAK
ncbi:MAG: crossover junction endodeoxyribonuclease RuvC [Deltaproteobacteria bacterium]|nr:crossover junction endodeoxyribonuclease RuvC [Deltaproteobacteria bacterium]